MSQFEYVTTLASFIVAFGVSRVLSGWVQQFVHRKEQPVYPLQLAVSALMLFALLQNSWSIWMARTAEWTFPSFLLLLLLQLAIVGALALINPPAGHPSSIRDYYFDVRKAVFGLLAVWITLGGVFDRLDYWTTGELSPDLPYELMYSIRSVAFGVFLWMAWSDRESHHWTGFAIAATIQTLWILAVSYAPG